MVMVEVMRDGDGDEKEGLLRVRVKLCMSLAEKVLNSVTPLACRARPFFADPFLFIFSAAGTRSKRHATLHQRLNLVRTHMELAPTRSWWRTCTNRHTYGLSAVTIRNLII